MKGVCIALTDVNVAFPTAKGKQKYVLRDLSLSIQHGERVALVGQNGSGKTTLLRVLMGAVKPLKGTVDSYLNGLIDHVSYVPQDYRNALFPWLSLKANLFIQGGLVESACLWRRMKGAAPLSPVLNEYKRIADVFRLELNLDLRPGSLSGGQQQLFLLVKALISPPKLLVLDEPLSAIDFGRKRLVRSFLGESLPILETTVVFASHDFDHSVLLSDRIVVLGRDAGVLDVLPVNLPWPRTLEMERSEEFLGLVSRVAESVL